MLKRIFAFILLSVFVAEIAWADTRHCANLLPPERLGALSPIEQLLRWEQTANLNEMLKPTAPVKVNFTLAPNLFIESLVADGSSKALELFSNGSFMNWPQHPLNSDSSVPFYDGPASGQLEMSYSASRSLFFLFENEFYSIKLPTNRPHPLGPLQPTKAQLKERAKLSVIRSQDIKTVDAELGPSPYMEVLPDIAAYTERDTGNGFVLRDLRSLQDGNYYLPGFSIPFVGQAIARHNKTDDLEVFWGTHYAKALGRAKATLLLRYGLLMNSPNTQNILVQLDKNFVPTGKIILRDIGDSRFYEPVANALGFGQLTRRDNLAGVELVSLLKLQTDTSFWQMDTAGIKPAIIANWEEQHDQGFVDAIVEELTLDPTKYKSSHDIQNLFSTDGGVALLQTYRAASKDRP